MIRMRILIGTSLNGNTAVKIGKVPVVLNVSVWAHMYAYGGCQEHGLSGVMAV